MIVLPVAPPDHDQQNQNETRRSCTAAISLIQARLAALEALLAAAN
jgi:hypothetical protein